MLKSVLQSIFSAVGTISTETVSLIFSRTKKTKISFLVQKDRSRRSDPKNSSFVIAIASRKDGNGRGLEPRYYSAGCTDLNDLLIF
jgi:hypothetical protein